MAAEPGLSAIELMQQTQQRLTEDSRREQKPRNQGLTMILVFDVANYGPSFIAPYSGLVDRVKLMDTLFHDDFGLVERAVAEYREMGISVACGGTQFELALAHGSMQAYVAMLRDLGVTEVEVEHHADDSSSERIQEEVRYFKEEGFEVVGEVGKKWWWKDPTRVSRDLISVDRTVEDIGLYLEAGADLVYWEGAVVGGLIGRQLENEKGQHQFREVVRQVDSTRVAYEIYDRRSQPLWPMIAWLVHELGPNVNLANIDPWAVKRVEWIRHGIIFEMDHPYMRWQASRSTAETWWQMDRPDYSIDVQRPYAFEKDF